MRLKYDALPQRCRIMRINREGYTIVFTSLIVAIAVSAALFIWAPLWVAIVVCAAAAAFFFFTLYFFREPERQLVQDDNLVYAPADGKVVVMEQVEEREYLGERRLQISVFMSLTNVHINWFPVGGTVEYFKYHPGKFLVAWHPKSSELNERTTTVVNAGGRRVLFRQVAGFVARRIVSYAKPGAVAEQNCKCGFIKFGSRVDILLPLDAEVLVAMGQKVTGSQTPIARLGGRP